VRGAWCVVRDAWYREQKRLAPAKFLLASPSGKALIFKIFSVFSVFRG